MTDPITQEAAGSAAPAPADATPGMVETKAGTLTQEQLTAWTNDELAAGRITQEQADAIVREAGGEAAPAVSDADATRAYLKEIGSPAAESPAEYQLPPLVGANEPYTADTAKVDAALRGWLYDAGLGRELGTSIANEVARVGAEQQNASDADREIYRARETYKLKQLWGDAYDARIRMANQLIRELDAKRPGLIRFLDDSGAGNSALLASMLGHHAELLNGRK